MNVGMHSTYAPEVFFSITWVLFCAWTVRCIWMLRDQHDRRVYSNGVLGFGVFMWVAMTFVAAYLGVQGDPRHRHFWFYGSRFLFLLFPLSLWGGYFWGRIMCHLFPRPPLK